MTLPVFILLCLGTNLVAGTAFCLDKFATVHAQRRIPEKHLLLLTLLGGIGAVSACTLIRHKTRKQPFRFYAEILCGLHVVLVAFVLALLV